MKYISGYLVLLSSALLISGCSDNSGSVSTDAYPLSVGSVSLNGVQTRSTTPLATEGATISVSTLSSGAVSGTSQYSYTGGAWGTALGSSGLLALEGTALCAYYPYSAGITNKATIPLSSVKYDASKDLSYGYANAVADVIHSTSHASFTLQHAYAQLTFSFTCAGSYTGSKSIGDIIISNPGILSGAALNITQVTGVYSSKVVGDVSFNAGITDFTSTPSASVLMVPTDALSGDLNILIQVGSDYKMLPLPATLFYKSKLEAGVNYQIAVNVNGTLTLGSTAVQATDWIAGTSTNNTIDCLIQPESNSYIVNPGSTILIPVSRATAGNSSFLSTDAFTCGLLWSDVNASHVTASTVGRYIKVTAGSSEGNSVVYAKNAAGDIVWSWHIWVTNYAPGLTANAGTNTTTYQSGNGLLWMDRNLGATSVADGINTFATCGGLTYQWGRKDPLPGSNGSTTGSATAKTLFGYTAPTTVGVAAVTAISGDNSVKLFPIGTSPVTVDNAFSYSVQYPLVFFANWAGSSATEAASATGGGGLYSWNTQTTNLKTLYDPCPVGWRAPAWIGGTASPWSAWNSSASFTVSATAYSTWSSYGNYAASGYRDYSDGTFYDVGSIGYYWSTTVSDADAYSLNFNGHGDVDPSYNNSRASAFSVRCVKN